jgi:hypothetical protein
MIGFRAEYEGSCIVRQAEARVSRSLGSSVCLASSRHECPKQAAASRIYKYHLHDAARGWRLGEDAVALCPTSKLFAVSKRGRGRRNYSDAIPKTENNPEQLWRSWP